MSAMIEVLEPGLATSVQDYPGRVGLSHLGYPPSGPLDSWSFRLANLLVGNDNNAAGLECQFTGPTLRFNCMKTIAVTGADMQPALDGSPIPLWTSIEVHPGQTLRLSHSRRGARAYIAFSGGLNVPVVLGSRSTFRDCKMGGLEGDVLRPDQQLACFESDGTPNLTVEEGARPPFPTDRAWTVEAVPGPNDDWLDEPCIQRFYSFGWKVTGKSSRTGYRLGGPDWTYSSLALDKHPDNGTNPSDILDHGYPMGGVNLAGQTPIILLQDGYSLGGLINPFTVPSAALWKVGQASPGERIFFKRVQAEEAQEMTREIERKCSQRYLRSVKI